jgi:hypothetical protein
MQGGGGGWVTVLVRFCCKGFVDGFQTNFPIYTPAAPPLRLAR